LVSAGSGGSVFAEFAPSSRHRFVDSPSHTSVAILDALNTFEGTVIEVHISIVHKREEFRHHSFVSKRADGVIAGFSTQGYLLGLRRVAKLLDETKE
jgi:3-dehydroquinate dehydratase II